MKILILTPYIPYPLSEGGKISQYAVTDRLRQHAEVHFYFIPESTRSMLDISELKKRWPDVVFHFIPFRRPSLWKRMDGYIRKYANRLYRPLGRLLFGAPVKPHSYERLAAPVGFRKETQVQHLNELIQAENFDIVQIELMPFIDLVLALPAPVKKVFVHHELAFARVHTEISTYANPCDVYAQYLLNFVKFRELSLLALYDAVLVFSEDDRQKLQKQLPAQHIAVNPFPVLENEFVSYIGKDYEVEKLVFVGGEMHWPNKDAVEWYIESLLTTVLKRKNLSLHVVGKWSKSTTRKYAHLKSVRFVGYVEDLKAYSQNSIMLVPVRSGSGIRTKILYAMAQGVPVISTAIGFEGIQAEPGRDLLVANSAEEFSEAIDLLCARPEYMHQMRRSAWLNVKELYNQDRICRLRLTTYQGLIAQSGRPA